MTALSRPSGGKGRIPYTFEGRLIYEWEQSLEEVNIYIIPPPGVTSSQFVIGIVCEIIIVFHSYIVIDIGHHHLKVGLKSTTQAYIDEDTGGPVKPNESMWTLVDKELNINLQKMNKGEVWDCALQGQGGQQLDVLAKEEAKKKILLERFQEEHPGFDFSGAEFNGAVPDARTFLGGVSRS